MKRIGVFVCWCGLNISGTVDVEKASEELKNYPGVFYADDYKYLCSDPGQELIKKTIVDNKLEGIVVAACSPNMHESTFRAAAKAAGLNPYRVEITNIREQTSWVHSNKEDATIKAIQLIKATVEKVKKSEDLFPQQIPLTKKVLVIGGGISGMTVALEVAEAGYPVILVEKDPQIGGNMAKLSETFPTLDCASCILTPKTAEVGRHSNITLMTNSEVVESSGYFGNFTVKIKKKPTFVDWEKCIGCMLCQEKCPKKTNSEFEHGMGKRKAISVAFPQAIPYRPIINEEECIYFKTGKCKMCVKVCPVNCIEFEQQENTVEENIGAIVVASGYDLLPKEELSEYGQGKYADVIDGMQFERIASASGPTEGVIRRPSDGRIPKSIVFIQCAGSRDNQKGRPYCSKICCMYTAKHAMLYKHQVHDGNATIFYMDIRAGGKGYEEFVQRAIEDDHVLYLRGRVARVYEEDGKLVVLGVDTLSSEQVRIEADLVVLATAVIPSEKAKVLGRTLKVGTDTYGFFNEAHSKLKPVESMTKGVFLAGCAQAPRDIPETVSQATGAAAKVITMFSKNHLVSDPQVAKVNERICVGCLLCEPICPYKAIEPEIIEVRTGQKVEKRQVAIINKGLCQGCGACSVACRSGAMNLSGFSNEQILEELKALCL
ncbi:MAG: FAD-dependent oxidoreductase [Alkaliphilus sp.]